MLALGFLLMKGQKGKRAAPSSSNGHNGHGTNGGAESVQLEAGKRYRFLGTLASNAPPPDEVRELLKLVAATDIRIRTRPPAALTFVVRLSFDVPFVPGSSHPQAPWLTLQQVEELPSEQGRRPAVPSKKTKRRSRKKNGSKARSL